MSYINWESGFETKIAAIDEQHKKLVGYINELHTAMHDRKAKEIIGPLLTSLNDYTNYHFKTEEKAFAQYNYSKKAEHTKQHNDLVAQLEKIVDDYKKGSIMITIELLDFLTKWLKEHILIDDKQYVPELLGKDIQGE
jgi:hemerythrin-like metal-binding protein